MADDINKRNNKPMSAPDDIPASDHSTLSDSHPSTDTGIDSEENYDEGLSGAAEASEPNAGNTVTGYNPEQDHRHNNS